MSNRPTPEQIAASHTLGEALLRFLLLSLPEPPAVEKRPASDPVRPVQVSGLVSPPTEAPPVKELLIGTRRAAGLLSISERTLWSLTAPRGPIPAVRIGTAVRYSVDDLRQWVKDTRK